MQESETVELSAADVLKAIGEPDKLDAVQKGWDASRPTSESIPCLEPEMLAEYWKASGFSVPIPDILKTTAAKIKNDPALRRFFAHTLWRTYDAPKEPWEQNWPSLEQALGEDVCGAFYLLAALDLVPRLRKCHASWSVPETVTRETLLQIRSMHLNYQMGKGGRQGIYLSQLHWLVNYLRNKYFRLGRLEYWARAFHGDVSAYRNKNTRETIALAADGSRFTHDGFKKHEPTEEDQEKGWTASLVKTETSVTGCPISPLGMALRKEITLPFSDWECVLEEGTSVLDMHIPAGGSLTPEACADSFRQAREFFHEHFPEVQPKAIVCGSWLFNTQLQEILPEDANLNVFQRQLYLYPVPSSGKDGLWFIFFQDHFDPATAPRDTRLQRSILDYLSRGNTWRSGRFFFMLDDLPHFGTEHYLRTTSLL